MNLFKISLSYIRRQKLTTFLNTLLLGLGIATIILLLLFSSQFSEKLERDAKGIDMVVGAKGSPLQLILSSVYHMDVPTGNISLAEVNKLKANRFIKDVIPLSLGDSYRTFRIVGTTDAYVKHFGASVTEGKPFDAPMEAVIGSVVAQQSGLKVGDAFEGAHGLVSGGENHKDHPYKVVGILSATNSVLDRLIVTSLGSVWDVHGLPHETTSETHTDEHAANSTQSTADSVPDPNNPQPLPVPPVSAPPMGMMNTSGGLGSPNAGGPEVTVALVKFASPIAAVMLPRAINSQTNMQAARPAEQFAQLLALVGVGVKTIRAFGYLLMLTAMLGVFIALYNAMQDRRYDLAMMRALGASRTKLLLHVFLEGLIYATLGIALGLLLGHAATEIVGQMFAQANQVALTGFRFVLDELWVVLLALGVGLVAAIIPAFQAYRTDIAKTLAE